MGCCILTASLCCPNLSDKTLLQWPTQHSLRSKQDTISKLAQSWRESDLEGRFLAKVEWMFFNLMCTTLILLSCSGGMWCFAVCKLVRWESNCWPQLRWITWNQKAVELSTDFVVNFLYNLFMLPFLMGKFPLFISPLSLKTYIQVGSITLKGIYHIKLLDLTLIIFFFSELYRWVKFGGIAIKLLVCWLILVYEPRQVSWIEFYVT